MPGLPSAMEGHAIWGPRGLCLGDYYRITLLDYPHALATYQQVASDCAGTVVGDEAQVIYWRLSFGLSPPQPGAAQAAFQQALEVFTIPRSRSALRRDGPRLYSRNLRAQAVDMLTQLITAYPTHPAIHAPTPFARTRPSRPAIGTSA